MKLLITGIEDLLLSSLQLVKWRDETDAAMESLFIVVFHELRDHLFRVIQRHRSIWTNAFCFQRSVEALKLAI